MEEELDAEQESSDEGGSELGSNDLTYNPQSDSDDGNEPPDLLSRSDGYDSDLSNDESYESGDENLEDSYDDKKIAELLDGDDDSQGDDC